MEPDQRIPPFVDLYPEVPGGRRTPFGPGGAGRLFVHVTNRNQCSYLLGANQEPDARRLEGAFPMGYATLFILQKVCGVERDESGRLREDKKIAKEFRHLERFAVLVDPTHAPVGGGAIVLRDVDLEAARTEARARCASPGSAAAVAIITRTWSWH